MTARGNVTRTLHRWKPGDPNSAEWLDQQRDAIERLQLGGQLAQVGYELFLWRQVFMARVESVPTTPDVLIAREYRVYASPTPPVIGTQNILVALPWLLRRTPFDGQTWHGISYSYTDNQTRQATDSSIPITLTEHITPSYQPGDIIHCARLVQGGTGVIDQSLGVGVLDLTVGRVWAADPPP